MTVRVIQLNRLMRMDDSRTAAAGAFPVLSLVALLVAILVFAGCTPTVKWPGAGTGEPNGPALPQAPQAPAQIRKAELLAEINRKFENPEAHLELGQLYHAEGLWSQAEYHYKVALGFDPVYWDAQAAMVKIMIDSGNAAEAKVQAGNYMNEVASSAQRSVRLGQGFQKQKMNEYALACYKQALRLAPDSASVNKQIGYYYLSVGDKPNAKDYLSRSFRLNPYQPDVAEELGKLGVEIRAPRKTPEGATKPDKIVQPSGQETKTTK